VATFIAWLLSWTFGLLFPILAPRVIRRLVRGLPGGRSRLLPRAHVPISATKAATPSAETVTPTCGMAPAPVPESYRTVLGEEGTVIPNLYYFAAWTDSGCLLGCDHHHRTVISAANCISEAGGYVVAVENGKYRALNDGEEELFRLAYSGGNAVARRFVEFKPVRALKPSLN
jgi:hypothetical protein